MSIADPLVVLAAIRDFLDETCACARSWSRPGRRRPTTPARRHGRGPAGPGRSTTTPAGGSVSAGEFSGSWGSPFQIGRSETVGRGPRAFAPPGETKSAGPLFGGRPRGFRRAAAGASAVPINMDENRLGPQVQLERAGRRRRRERGRGPRDGRGIREKRSCETRQPTVMFSAKHSPESSSSAPCSASCLACREGTWPLTITWPCHFLDDEVADSPVRELANVRLDPLRQARPGVRTIENHGVTLGGDAKESWLRKR